MVRSGEGWIESRLNQIIIIIIKVYSLKYMTFIMRKWGQKLNNHNGNETQNFLISALADSIDLVIFILSGAMFYYILSKISR